MSLGILVFTSMEPGTYESTREESEKEWARPVRQEENPGRTVTQKPNKDCFKRKKWSSLSNALESFSRIRIEIYH